MTDTADPDAAPAVFTGGSLLYGSVGRTDLVDPAPHRRADPRAVPFRPATRAASCRRRRSCLPTHGFGSFCSAGSATGGDTSTIGAERERNDALTTADEQTFVDSLIANLTAYPAYYAHMAPLNRRGPAEPDLTAPRAIDPAELADRLAGGEWVVDLRSRIAYAADHLAATVSVELGDKFSTYVGWLSPWDGPLTLIGETPEQIAEARLQLVRIGMDELAGAATGRPDELAGVEVRRSYPRVDFAMAARELGDEGVVVDVRRDDEYADGHIRDAVHIPLDQLVDACRRATAAAGCGCTAPAGSGHRSRRACSIGPGRDVVHVDDDFENAAAAGLSIEREAAANYRLSVAQAATRRNCSRRAISSRGRNGFGRKSSQPAAWPAAMSLSAASALTIRTGAQIV